MKKLALATTLFLCTLSQLLGATDPAAQQLLTTAKQQASLFHDQASPFQIDVDFVVQINVPIQGHSTLKWDAKDHQFASVRGELCGASSKETETTRGKWRRDHLSAGRTRKRQG
jgi:hypothetical protein